VKQLEAEMPTPSGLVSALVVLMMFCALRYFFRAFGRRIEASMKENERALVEKHCPQLLREILYTFKTQSGELSSAYTPALRNVLVNAFGYEKVESATDAIRKGEMDFPVSEKRTRGGGYRYFLAKFDGPKYMSGSTFIAYGGKMGL